MKTSKWRGLIILAVGASVGLTGGLLSFHGGQSKQEIGSLLFFLGFVIMVPGFLLHAKAVLEAMRLKREKEKQEQTKRDQKGQTEATPIPRTPR